MGGRELSRTDIEGILPHRRPFLFLESAVIVEPGKRATGKLPDLNHPDFAYLKGHFPGLPIFPGALVMETLAELAGVAASSAEQRPELAGKVGVLVGDQMTYRRAVTPKNAPDITLEANLTTLTHRGGEARVRAMLGDKVAAEGRINFLMADKSKFQETTS